MCVLASTSLHTKFEMHSFAHSKDRTGPQNLKVGHVTPDHASFRGGLSSVC